MKEFYRKLDKYLLVLTFLCFLASCSSSKRIAYFQDLKPGESELFTSLSPHYIKVLPGDKITILINSREPQLAELFNLAITAKAIGTTSNNSGILSYTVDLEGYIEFPVLGAINVNGKTRKEIASLIKEELISRELLKDPVVTVEFANLCISVLGEVKTPGRYSIDRDKVTLLDAIGMAGDLTIYGKRDKVFVLRENGGTRYSYSVNLCSAEDLFSSPAYYLQQNDIVYVEPGNVRANQSTVNGNTIRSTSFWISVTSLIASLISIFL